MRTSTSSDRSGEETPLASTSQRPFDAPSNTHHQDMPLPLPAQRNRVRRLASKPLKIAGSIRRGLSPAPGKGRGAAGSGAGIGPSHLAESVVASSHTHEMQGMALESGQAGGGGGGDTAGGAMPDKDMSALSVRGRTKPLEGEEPVVLLRVRVVRCEGLVAKDRNGSSDPFIALTLSPTPRQQTPVIRRSLAPDYSTSAGTVNKSTFDFPLFKSLAESGYYAGRGLEVVVWDKDLIRKEYMGEVAVPSKQWFSADYADAEDLAWTEGKMTTKSFPLVSSRRRSRATGSIFLQFGLVPVKPGGEVRDVWADLAAKGRHSSGGLMGVPAYEGIGTVKIRRNRLTRAASKPASALHSLISSSSSSRVPTTSSSLSSDPSDEARELDDIDELDEDEDLPDDGGLSSSSDEDGEIEQIESGTSRVRLDGAAAGTPAVHVQDVDGPSRKSTSSSNSQTAASSALDLDRKPGYFDVRPGAKRTATGASTRTQALSTAPGTPGSMDSGALTPGGRRRRPIFRKKKTRNTSYNFGSEKDVLGIVMLEVQSADDLPKVKNWTALKLSFDMDPFVVISFGKKVFRTRVIRHSLNPSWDEKLLFHVRRYEDAFAIHFSVLDWDKVSGNDFIGSCSIPLADLVANAPTPAPKTGLYNVDEDGKQEMRDFVLPISTSQEAGWESRHSPHLHVRAKYEPYDALRQRFWRQYCAQYDTDDTGTLSWMELTTMLDSLSSTLTNETLESYFTDHGKSADTDELTFDEVVMSLEREIKKSASEKHHVDADGGYESGGQTPADYPMAPQPATDGLDTIGPASTSPAPIDTEQLSARLAASGPRGDFATGETNLKPLETDGSASRPRADSISPSLSRAESESEDARTDSPSDPMERVVNIKSCPLCQRPRLNAKSEADIVTHLAVCASADWNRIDRLVIGNYVTASQAQRKFLYKVLNKVTTGAYQLGANSANIIVQDRESGQLMEEKMAVYVRLGIRVLYKGAKRGMEGSRARKLLRSMSVKQGKKYDSPSSAAEIPNFINFHELNVNEILQPLDSFKTFNEFFYRKLKPDARPVSSPTDPSIAVSCADCRMMAFETVSEATRIWIKGREFSVGRLLGDTYKDQFEAYEGGALGIFRLAPQDYHRFHSPVDGTVGKCADIAGEYYTVNPQAIRTTLDVYGENVRKIVPIDSPIFGRVMTVWIGAMMVGSIGSTVQEGDQVKRGDELGWFAFGGSTIVLLFERGALRWDEDLLQNGRASIETLVRMGTHVGVAQRKTSSSPSPSKDEVALPS